MSMFIPWAETAQFSEFSTQTSFVGTLRDCLASYEALPIDARIDALLIADTDIMLPGRAATKILEQPELDILSAQFGSAAMSTEELTALVEYRDAA